MINTRKIFHVNELGLDLKLTNVKVEKKFFNIIFLPIVGTLGEVEPVMVLTNDVIEQVLARQKVEKADHQLKLALSSKNIGAWDLEVPSNILKIDDTGLRVFGISPQEFPGTLEYLYARVHPEDHDFVQKELKVALEQKGTMSRDYRVIWPDNSVH